MKKTHKKAKSWQEKLMDSKDLPKVVALSGKSAKRWGKGTLAIPAPKDVDKIMKGVPKGKLITTSEIRSIIAKRHKATVACPLTTGIFTWIAANAAEETKKSAKSITPYWRTLKSGGVINEKYPGGVAAQKRLLKEEGYDIVQKGRQYIVRDFEKYLVKGGAR